MCTYNVQDKTGEQGSYLWAASFVFPSKSSALKNLISTDGSLKSHQWLQYCFTIISFCVTGSDQFPVNWIETLCAITIKTPAALNGSRNKERKIDIQPR